MKKILIVTHSPSPYQIELFDAVNGLPEISLRVVYLFAADPVRAWAWKEPRHEYCTVSDKEFEIPHLWEKEADLLVVNYYRHPAAAALMKRRIINKKAWAFWGERPGFKHSLLGRMARMWLLRPLHCTKAPIWGIGEYAIQGYQEEFGSNRQYLNLPYFSDLNRFSRSTPRNHPGGKRVILFSGSLIPRKGVDLLAKAFVRIAPQNPGLRLCLLGSGELEKELRKILAPVAGQVSFIGFKDWEDLPSVYTAADVLCVPSRYDGWGLVVPEGLAAGLPVIATYRMGAALDLLKDGVNGWIIEPDDLPGLVAVLQKVAKLGKNDLRGMSSAARHSVEKHGLAHGARRFVRACYAAVENWTT